MSANCTFNHDVQQGDWSRFAYPVQRSYGKSVDEWSDQPLVPASWFFRYGTGLSQEPYWEQFRLLFFVVCSGSCTVFAIWTMIPVWQCNPDVWSVRTELSELRRKFSQRYCSPFLSVGMFGVFCTTSTLHDPSREASLSKCVYHLKRCKTSTLCRGCQGCALDWHQRRRQCVIGDIDGDAHRRTCKSLSQYGKRLSRQEPQSIYC